MSSRALSCLFAATALLSVACEDTTGLRAGDAANVRIVNASSVVGDVDVLVNGSVQTNASGVSFLNASGQCVRVAANNPGLTFQQTGGTVQIPATSFAFDAAGRNTVVIAGTSSTNLRVMTISDPLTPPLAANRARIRVINARATTTMGATITPWNETPGTPATINTSTTPATAWVDVPAGETIAVRLTTTTGTVIDVLNFVAQSGQELTLVVVDPASGQTGVRWIVTTPCGRP